MFGSRYQVSATFFYYIPKISESCRSGFCGFTTCSMSNNMRHAIIANFKPQNYLKFPAPPKQAVKHTDMGNQQARRMASAAIGEVESGNVVDESVSSPIRKSPLAPLTYGWVEAVS